MVVSSTDVLKFRCQAATGECIMGLHEGLSDDYEVKDGKLLFRGKVLGGLGEKTIADIICYEHCHERYFDEVLGAPHEERLSFSVVSRFSKPRDEFPIDEMEEENDF